MYIEERGWVKAKILLTKLIYWKIQDCKKQSTSIQSSDFNLPFQIVIYHPILSNNYNNVLEKENHLVHSLHQA